MVCSLFVALGSARPDFLESQVVDGTLLKRLEELAGNRIPRKEFDTAFLPRRLLRDCRASVAKESGAHLDGCEGQSHKDSEQAEGCNTTLLKQDG